jgi:hypothetical protein
MRFRLLTAALVVCLGAAAQSTLTVEQLISFIRSSIKLKQPDRQVAAFLSKVKLTERLDDRIIEDLQGEGMGPRTLETLKALRAQTVALPKARIKEPEAKPTPIPPPSPEEQAKVLDEVREYALNYSKNLPDFICTQVVRRYIDPRGLEYFQLMDTLTVRLSYFEQKEDYKLILVNNTPATQSYQQLGGATSSGEFGSMLKAVFERNTQARFQWDHWATLRKRRALVFAYHVAQMNSQWHIDFERKQDIITAYNGLVYVDRDTHQVLRLTLDAVDIPPAFPVQQAKTVLDYDYVDLSGHPFLLPLKAEIRMRAERQLTRNDVEFRLYRKFSAETEIKFDTPDALPEDQTKEQRLPK